MAAIYKLLQSLQPELPRLCHEDGPKLWCFKTKLLDFVQPESEVNGDNVAFFRPFIYDYNHLLVIYALNCSLIAKSIPVSPKIDVNNRNLEAHLVNALALANLFHVINIHYLNSPHECRRFEEEEVIFRRLLYEFGYRFKLIKNLDLQENDALERKQPDPSITKWFRQLTASSNWPRLQIVRVKRVLDALVPILKNLPNFVSTIQFIDMVANPIFAYLAWAFYLPRLSLNIFIFLKNVLPHPWMCSRRQQLGFYLRFKSEFLDKWFELGNDSVWFAVGLINCFVLVGSLSPWAIYLTVSLYAFDVILAAIRAYVELNALYNLKNQLIELSNDLPHSQKLDDYLNELDQNIHYESQRLGLSLVSTLGLFAGMLFAFPAFAGNPVIPLIGAVFIVVWCVSTLVAGKYIDSNKSTMPLPSLTDTDLKQWFKSLWTHQLTRSSSAFFDERLVHNHSSNDITPSNSDSTVTENDKRMSSDKTDKPDSDRKPRYDRFRFSTTFPPQTCHIPSPVPTHCGT